MGHHAHGSPCLWITLTRGSHSLTDHSPLGQTCPWVPSPAGPLGPGSHLPTCPLACGTSCLRVTLTHRSHHPWVTLAHGSPSPSGPLGPASRVPMRPLACGTPLLMGHTHPWVPSPMGHTHQWVPLPMGHTWQWVPSPVGPLLCEISFPWVAFTHGSPWPWVMLVHRIPHPWVPSSVGPITRGSSHPCFWVTVTCGTFLPIGLTHPWAQAGTW